MGVAIPPRGDMPKNRVLDHQGRVMSVVIFSRCYVEHPFQTVSPVLNQSRLLSKQKPARRPSLAAEKAP